MGRRFFACLAAAALIGSTPKPAPTATPQRTIAMTVNGEFVKSDAHPRVVGGRIYVPFRATFEAVGIDTERRGNTLSAVLPNGELSVDVGSPHATLNGKPIDLDSSVVDIRGTAYVPLRFLNQSIGANATFDSAAARVDIVSGYVGRNLGPSQPGANGQMNVIGSVAAIDRNSAPPSITVVQAGSARTIAISSAAAIYIEDTTIRSQIRGSLGDVRVGDALRAVVAKDGSVLEVHAFFRSLAGTISAVSGPSFVLSSGRVVTPDRDTEITLNEAAAAVGDLKVGDTVTIRSNPETGTLRQVIASRASAAGAAKVNVSITAFVTDLTRPLRAGDSFNATLQGTRGGKASFDIADFVENVPMVEESPGVYRGTFKIPDRFNVAELPIYGRLSVGPDTAPRIAAPQRLSSSTLPPQIPEVAPQPGQTINNRTPNIYATFFVPSEIGVDPRTIVVIVNGQDVSANATRTRSYVSIAPANDLPAGENHITVRVADAAGNVQSRSWSFFVR
jgi:sulfur carrier protein ThiS